MKAENQKPEVPRDFYRPHKRVFYNPQLVDHKTGEFFTPERRVKQSFVSECDINTIMKQYSATGQIRHISSNAAKGAYIDLPDELDFQASLQIVQTGQDAFATLPSKARDRFNNDPATFLEFMADPANAEEIVRLGLGTKRPDPTPSPVPPAAPSQGGAGVSPAPATKAPDGASGAS